MSVLTSLAREHKVFKPLLDRLERSLGHDEKRARDEIRETLLVLLPALDLHEEIEETVFGHPVYASKEDAKLLLGENEYQHQRIQTFRMELIDALGISSKESFIWLKSVISKLTLDLRVHFETEEKNLWPHYRIFSRSLDASIKRRLEEKVRELREDVKKQQIAVADYLSLRR